MSAPAVEARLGAALARNRERLNAHFRLAEGRRATLDGEAVKARLAAWGNALFAVLEAEERQQDEAVAALFEVVVLLASRGEVGEGEAASGAAESPSFATAFGDALPRLAAHVARAPRRVVASLANAALAVAAHAAENRSADPALPLPDAGAATFVRRMAAAAAASALTLDQLLSAGAVAAWSLGLAQARASALRALATLPHEAAAAALGAAPARDADQFGAVRARLGEDLWHKPGMPDPPRGPRFQRAIGGFIGSGGRFLSPPKLAVAASGEHVIATDGARAYHVYADAFGSAWVPLPLAELPQSAAAPTTATPAGLDLSRATSLARVGTTLAVATRDSLKIRFFAGV